MSLSAISLRFRYVMQKLLGWLRPANRRVRIDRTGESTPEDTDPGRRYSQAWYEDLYEALGDGITCYRPDQESDYSGGALQGCRCCHANLKLHLLPGEERMFETQLNTGDFQLIEHPTLAGRKTIVCSKLGQCGGRKPFVCRTHPVHFADGLVLFEEGLCRLTAAKYFSLHGEAIERLRAAVLARQLQSVPLGYGRVVDANGTKGHCDFER